jgi:hypothetical protein
VFDRYDIVTEDDLRTALGKLDTYAVTQKTTAKARAGQVRRFKQQRTA